MTTKKDYSNTRHIPVLLEEVMERIRLQPGERVLDATLGGGGYTKRFLSAVGRSREVIALDVDGEAITRFRKALGEERKNLILRQGNFSDIQSILEELKIKQVNVIVADLGFSSDQMEDSSRGFSFQNNGPLDMRLDQSAERSARDLVAILPEKELATIFSTLGEERESGRIARAIVKRRASQPFTTTCDLAQLIEEVYPRKKRYAQNIHPATKVFQALRMAVNQEKEHLEKFLEGALSVLAPGGRIAIVSFHSGEDRLVKRFFQQSARECVCPPDFPQCVCGRTSLLRILTKKPIIPTEKEREKNPRARSAKLRVAQREKET